MSDTEIMEFPYGSFLKLRLEFVLLRDNELEAKIMRIIEGWMIEQKKVWLNECAQSASNGKPEPPEPDYYVTLSYAQIIAQLYMFNSSRKGEGKEVAEGKRNSITRRTVSKAVQALTDDKIVFTRPNPNPTKEYDAVQYKLNCPLVQKQMKLLPKNPMSYLGSNGRISGTPCEIISHPPRENNSHPMRNDFTPPCENFAGGDVKNFPTLIDIDNRDTNRMNERENAEPVSTEANNSSSHSSIPSSSLPRETARKTDELDPLSIYDDQEKRIHGYWLELGYESDINLTNKGHWGKLAKHVKSFEDMDSLFKYTRRSIEQSAAKDKTVYPGNLVKCVNGWKQNHLPDEPKEEKAHEKSALGVSGLPLSMSDPNEPRLPYKFIPSKRRRAVTQ